MSSRPEEQKPAVDDAVRLAAMLRGHVITQLIAAATRMRIPDLLSDGPVTAEELSRATRMSLHETRRFLRALVGLEIVETAEVDTYKATPLARHLRSDTGSMYGQALMAGREYYDAWAELDFALTTNTSGFEQRFGVTLWEHFQNHQEVGASFTRTMRWNTTRALDEILALYAFPEQAIVADLGAGDGTLAAGLLKRFPGLTALILEQESIIERTRRSLSLQGLEQRCTFVAGDILVHVPEGADLYLLKSVIHNWNDEMALRILVNCRAAMANGARLLLLERARTDESFDASVRDLTMLVLFGGRDRSVTEYESLLHRAGFAVSATSVGPSGLAVVEATPTGELTRD